METMPASTAEQDPELTWFRHPHQEWSNSTIEVHWRVLTQLWWEL